MAVRQCGRTYGLRRLRAAASEAQVAGMGKGDFENYPCLFGGDFPSGGIILGRRNFWGIGGENSIRLGFPSYAARPLGNAPDNPRRVSGGRAPCGVRRIVCGAGAEGVCGGERRAKKAAASAKRVLTGASDCDTIQLCLAVLVPRGAGIRTKVRKTGG